MSETRIYSGRGTVKAGAREVRTRYTVRREVPESRITASPGIGRSLRPRVEQDREEIKVVELQDVTASERASLRKLDPVLILVGGSELPIGFDESGGVRVTGNATWAEDEPVDPA